MTGPPNKLVGQSEKRAHGDGLYAHCPSFEWTSLAANLLIVDASGADCDIGALLLLDRYLGFISSR